jgi:hypothetical protein
MTVTLTVGFSLTANPASVLVTVAVITEVCVFSAVPSSTAVTVTVCATSQFPLVKVSVAVSRESCPASYARVTVTSLVIAWVSRTVKVVGGSLQGLRVVPALHDDETRLVVVLDLHHDVIDPGLVQVGAVADDAVTHGDVPLALGDGVGAAFTHIVWLSVQFALSKVRTIAS